MRVILLDRPNKRNALDLGMVSTVSDAVGAAPGRAIVLGSTDPGVFCSGADLGLVDEDRARVSDALYGLYLAMRSAPQIVVAAASGHAVGGGAQLLIASDIRIAGHDLTIRLVGPGHGLAVGAWGLPSLVGRGRAMDLCLSMRPVGSEEALSMGLVDRVTLDPLAAAVEYADRLMELDPLAVARVKRVVGTSDPGQALRQERSENAGWDGVITVPGDS